MSFKEEARLDVKRVFLNLNEFGERRSVRVDGETYENIPVVLEGPAQEKRGRLSDDHVLGLHEADATLYCALEDLGGRLPKQGSRIEVATREESRFFKRYYVSAAVAYMGMAQLGLEAVEQ